MVAVLPLISQSYNVSWGQSFVVRYYGEKNSDKAKDFARAGLIPRDEPHPAVHAIVSHL